MDLVLTILHLTCALLLIVSHALFFFRGLAIEAGRITPVKLDHLARSLSQALLPATAVSGLILHLSGYGSLPPAHLLLGLAPLAAIPLVFFGRLLLKKKTRAPWLLPAVNLILILLAAATGSRIWR